MLDAAKNLTAAEIRVGENWDAIRAIIRNRTHWGMWMKNEAPKHVPGVTPKTILKQIKAWEAVKGKPLELRNLIVERGVRPTQGFMTALRSVEQEEAAQRAMDRVEAVPNNDPGPEPVPTEIDRAEAEKLFEKARTRYDGQIAQTRATAGKSGGRSRRKGTPTGLSELRIDAYAAVRDLIEQIDADAQHDWLLDLVKLCFGSGLGETSEITVVPQASVVYRKFSAAPAPKQTATEPKKSGRKLKNLV